MTPVPFLADGPARGADLSRFGRFTGSRALDHIGYEVDGSTTVRRGESDRFRRRDEARLPDGTWRLQQTFQVRRS